MPDKIPELNTSNVSLLGYYNLTNSELDQTYQPHDLNFTTENNSRYESVSSDTYDNAFVHKVKDTSVNREFILRAGSHDHKWITSHMITDNYNSNNGTFSDFTLGNAENLHQNNKDRKDYIGDYDLMNWTDRYNSYDISENTLFNLIEKSLNETGYWNRSSLIINNSGLYDYSIPNDHNISTFSEQSSKNTVGFAFTDDTKIHKSLVTFSTEFNYLYINDEVVAKTGLDNSKGQFVAYDTTDIVDSDKEIKYSITQWGSGVSHNVSINCVVVWS